MCSIWLTILGASRASESPPIAKNLIAEVILDPSTLHSLSAEYAESPRLPARGETEVGVHLAVIKHVISGGDIFLDVKPLRRAECLESGPAAALSLQALPVLCGCQ